MLLPVLAALLGIFAFSPFPSTYWFGFIFLTPLFIFYKKEHALSRLLLGTVLFRLLFALGTVYYILEPIAWGISLLIFCGLPISIYTLRVAYKKVTRSQIPVWMLLVSLPILWTIWDVITAHYSPLPTTIISAGNVLGSSPFMGIAAIGGMTGLTLFVAAINGVITAALPRPHKKQNDRYIYKAIIDIAAIIAVSVAVSQVLINQRITEYAQRKRNISITALSVSSRLTSTQRGELLTRIAQTPADLVIFPEGFFSKFDQAPYRTEKEISTSIAPLLPSVDSVGVGALDFKPDGANAKYGSAAVVKKDGTIEGMHNKVRLSFGGEYWPFGDWHPSVYDWLKSQDPSIGTYAMFGKQNGYASGKPNVIQATVGGEQTTFAALVCMEMQYLSDITWYRAQGAQFIANPTSNRWLTSGKDHFLFLANNLRRIESIQLDVPIIISGIEDIGGIFTPDGRKQAVYYRQTTKGYAILSASIKL